tara:strand:+ start:1420 stop:1557 length:138 start_codon:yes stop_codon:yes gene_type:complete
MAKGYQPRRMSTYKPINTFQQKRMVIIDRKSMSKNNLIEAFSKTE